jgi:hypothetical protein
MLAAVFGLVGVVIGGLLNGAVNWRLERARERLAARASARLLSDSLARLDKSLPLMKRASSVQIVHPDVGASLDDWAQHRERLAPVLSIAQWTAVADCVPLLRELDATAELERHHGAASGGLDAWASVMHEGVGNALAALDDLRNETS